MKPSTRPCIVLAILLLSLAVPSRADIRAWRADLASEEVHNEYVRRGDSATLRVAVYLRGREYRPSTAVARFRAGLDSPDWLQAPCSIASNVVEVAWTPLLAPGADVVPMIVHVDGEVYRIPLMLYVRDSPGGDDPGGLPVLDFGAYALTNAPWALPSDLPALPLSVANGGTGADTAAGARASLGAASVADATLTDAGAWVFAADVLDAARSNLSEVVHAPNRLEVRATADPAVVSIWLVPEDDTNAADFAAAEVADDGLSMLLLGGMDWLYPIVAPASTLASRASRSGYLLGSQTDKSLAAAADLEAAALAATNYTDASFLAATNYTDAAVRSLPAVTNVTVGGVPLAGLLPEYVVSPETARGAAYTGVSRDTALRDGKMILYYMQTQANGAWTLNLTLADGTQTGAKPVRFWGTSTVTTHYSAGSIIPLVYRSGAWYVSDRDTNENTYDRVRVSSYVRFSASTTKYAICCGTTDGYRKVAPGVVFDASMPILYANVNATSAAGAQSNNFYASMPGVDVRNTVSGFASRRGKPLYLVGSLAADGRTFTIGDPALTYEATPPCIPLGLFNNNADNQLHFLPGPLLSGQTGDASAVTNLVADLLADEVDALPVQSTLEVHRLVLADLWDRVDRMSGSSDADTIDDILLALDGLDARLTALEARSGVTATRMAALEASVGTTATRMAAIEASSAATAARMSALSGPSTVPAASDLQAPGTINASAVQDSAGAQ